MSFARATWTITVGICALAGVLLEVGGYSGYAIVVGAVGLAAAVNLLPRHQTDPQTPAQGPPGSGPPDEA